ncbi:MAG: aromatic amino acid lyase, partial [Nitrospinae bacterium]|nr:aromatic amino acid lyase [Nitrospinota bacterium]
MKPLVLNGDQLTLDDVVTAVHNGWPVKVSAEAKQRVKVVRSTIEKAVREKKVIYGITTGFGAFSNVTISRAQGKQLQKNILMSHAAGVGPSLPEDAVRGVLLLMINSKAKGYSGMRPQTLETLVKLFNKQVVPVVPEQGSVGASG